MSSLNFSKFVYTDEYFFLNYFTWSNDGLSMSIYRFTTYEECCNNTIEKSYKSYFKTTNQGIKDSLVQKHSYRLSKQIYTPCYD